MGNSPSHGGSSGGSNRRHKKEEAFEDIVVDKAQKLAGDISQNLRKLELLDLCAGPVKPSWDDYDDQDSRTISEEETTITSYRDRRKRDDQTVESSYISDDRTYDDETTTLHEPSTNLSKPLASSFAKRCYFTKAGIGSSTQHYEGLTLTGNVVLMLSSAMKLKGCPTICDEDLRRVEQTYPNQFSRLPDELLLSSGWRRISKYCSFSNKPIPDGIPFFHSTERLNDGAYYFLLAAAVGMVRPIDVEPLNRDTLVLLETDYPDVCDKCTPRLIQDPNKWILVDKFCFFSGGPINESEDVFYEADFDGNPIFMLAFLSPSLTPDELYKLNADTPLSAQAVEEVESVYDLTERDFDDLKLYHLGPCRALPQYILQPDAWKKVLPQHFLEAREAALERVRGTPLDNVNQFDTHRAASPIRRPQKHPSPLRQSASPLRSPQPDPDPRAPGIDPPEDEPPSLRKRYESSSRSTSKFEPETRQPHKIQRPFPPTHPEDEYDQFGPPDEYHANQDADAFQIDQPFDQNPPPSRSYPVAYDPQGPYQKEQQYEDNKYAAPQDEYPPEEEQYDDEYAAPQDEYPPEEFERVDYTNTDEYPTKKYDPQDAYEPKDYQSEFEPEPSFRDEYEENDGFDPNLQPEDFGPPEDYQQQENYRPDDYQPEDEYYDAVDPENHPEPFDEPLKQVNSPTSDYSIPTVSEGEFVVNTATSPNQYEQFARPDESPRREFALEAHDFSPRRNRPPPSPRSGVSSDYSQTSAMRDAQEIIRRNRQRQDPPNHHPTTPRSASTYDSSSEYTGSSVWTDDKDLNRSSRRALILQMARARMKHQKETELEITDLD